MPEQLLKSLAELEQVEAIALGGSRAGTHFDEKSDYDVYVYVKAPVEEETRRRLLSEHCSYMEIGNHFWEYEDNCVLNNGIDIDILYRDLDDFCRGIENVAVRCQPSNSYTTCMWHNLLNCRILYDETGRLAAAKERYAIPYPEALKAAIVERQLKLLDSAMPAYPVQIRKAVKRGDLVSVNHRTAEFLASYFDLIFAINGKTHPGETRLTELCLAECSFLPEHFEENLESLFRHMYAAGEEQLKCLDAVEAIVEEVKKLCAALGYPAENRNLTNRSDHTHDAV